MCNTAHHVRAATRCTQPLGFHTAYGNVVLLDADRDSSGAWASAKLDGQRAAAQLQAGIRALLEFRWGVRVR